MTDLPAGTRLHDANVLVEQHTRTPGSTVIMQPEVEPLPQKQRQTVDTPFVPDRPAREGLKPGQWRPTQDVNVQAEIARRGLLQNMYYCLGVVPPGGFSLNTPYTATAMGTRLAFWIGPWLNDTPQTSVFIACSFLMGDVANRLRSNHVVNNTILHATFSVFADDTGELHALSSTCTHRGAQLSKGTVEVVNGRSCVRCPYHAWAFSGDGKVQDIPVQSDGCFPKRALQESYNILIQGNLLWMFWGQTEFSSDECPPIPGLHHRDVRSKV